MRILICDDSELDLKNTKRVVEEFVNTSILEPCEVLTFTKPFDFLEEIDKNGAPDLCLLDICMPGILGTELASVVNSCSNETTDLIFLTNSSEFAVEAFTLHASDYLKKPFSDKKLLESLKRVCGKRSNSHFIAVSCKAETYRVDLLEILYVETLKNSIEIHLKNGKTLITNSTLKKFMENFLEIEGFIQVGVSYIVNLRFVQIFHPTTLEMTNGDLISIPRRLKVDIKKQYFDFYKKEAIK